MPAVELRDDHRGFLHWVYGSIPIMRRDAPKDIDDYIAGFPKDIREILQKVRTTIRKAIPDAQEAIKYQIPTFVLNGNVVHFAAFKEHIGFYPAPQGIETFKKELAKYDGSKGTVRFPYNRPIPYGLIGRIAKYRARVNREKAKR
jgi:uncharacterized protein YdhG (YjbR/CyaY superfamily)